MTDLVIGGSILLSALAGWRSGLVRQIVSLVGMFLAFFLAKSFYLLFAPLLKTFLPVAVSQDKLLDTILGLTVSGSLYNGISFVILFVLFFFAIRLIGYLLDTLANLPGLSLINRPSGLALGFVLGILVVGIVVNVLALLPSADLQHALAGSQLAQVMLGKFSSFVPKLQSA